jgi:hypothetical protein
MDENKKKEQIEKEGFESYQECYPLEADEDEEMSEYTVTKKLGTYTEDAQTIFSLFLIFLISAMACSFAFPYLTINAVAQDLQDGGKFFRGLLTAFFWFILVIVFILFFWKNTFIDRLIGNKNNKQTKLVFAIFLFSCSFFIFMSVTFAKVSGMKVSEKLSFDEYFDSDSAMSYLDIFGLMIEPTELTEQSNQQE